jgi:DNA-binding MarR family transcriptional regulator
LSIVSSSGDDPAVEVADYPITLLVLIAQRVADDHLLTSLREAGFDDITKAHGLVFEMLDPEGSRVTDMARRARMTKQGMGQLVQAVERMGLVERAPDPTDGRAQLVRLTLRGTQAVAAARRGSAGLERIWRERLGERRYQATRKALVDLAVATGLEHVR